jgi:hypothetical protein
MWGWRGVSLNAEVQPVRHPLQRRFLEAYSTLGSPAPMRLRRGGQCSQVVRPTSEFPTSIRK